MLEESKKALQALLDDPEAFKLEAEALKKFHSALKAAGFYESQATQIVALQGVRMIRAQ